jgi:hypothetical protein
MPYITETEYSNLQQEIVMRDHQINILKKNAKDLAMRVQQLNASAYVMAMRLLQSEFYLTDEEIRTEVDYVLHLNK